MYFFVLVTIVEENEKMSCCILFEPQHGIMASSRWLNGRALYQMRS